MFKYRKILALLIIVAFFIGCSKKPSQENIFSNIKILKKTSESATASPNEGLNAVGKPQEIKNILYKTKSDKLRASFKVSTLFSVREFTGSNDEYSNVVCVENTDGVVYPASFSLSYQSSYLTPYSADTYLDDIKAKIAFLRNMVVETTGGEDIFGRLGKSITITYNEYFPAYVTPVQDVKIRQKITVFEKDGKVYVLRYAALDDKYIEMQSHYDLFLQSLILES